MVLDMVGLAINSTRLMRAVQALITSGNDLVKRFVDKADKTTRDEIERLVTGEKIEKSIRLELTYDEIDNSIDNLWSVLFMTGYLTQE